MKHEKIIIIGAGPAGIAAAIQLQHFGFSPILFEKGDIGGLLRNAQSIQNFPGISYGISGIELIAIFKDHLEKKHIKIIKSYIEKIDFNNQFILFSDTETFTADRVIIATGTSPLSYSCANNKNVFYEVYPIRQVENKTIAIVGAGDAAFDYANTLLPKNKVIILNRSERIKANRTLYNEVMEKKKNLVYIKNVTIENIQTNESGSIRLILTNNESHEVDYVIAAIGRKQTMPEFTQKLQESKEYLQIKKKLLFIGDVKNNHFRQSSISIGEGVKAAMEMYDVLTENEEHACD